MTPPERRLWSRLKGRQIAGLRFRRQHPLGPYVADFYCHEATIVIEVDSAHHQAEQHRRDRRRDGWMKSQGIRTLRFQAVEIRDNIEGVLETIKAVATQRIVPESTKPPSDPSQRR